ncbi:XcbB/CpsF family capsular polysaccharide biosynthesis protein [Arthrobacter sp. EPSL27]|uniref:XcbB/CpsF family capsular polysaccharide biosynthesis protein n=1 Tax=Arthrobacter sp. EPSL27 TaxID=1745378 RepID=UPI000AE1B44D|nr:XcbB/CpsF family capsular polysaccharide biosynthesis protein [Arthrobacter sp. EPSL27]
MSDAVIQIPYNNPWEDTASQLSSTTKYVHVTLAEGSSEDMNLIRLARKIPAARSTLVGLTNSGFHAYLTRENVTRLVRYDSIPDLWLKVKDGEYSVTEEGVVYTYTPPLAGALPKRLIVVFSSIHEDMYTTSLTRHFMQNFPTIQKYLPSDAAVLRIADLGGVAGSFYLNTTYLRDNVMAIQRLLSSVTKLHRIGHDSVVLYGVSKGGTGALYHALRGGYRCVAVDPIVSDVYYEERYGDSHFTANGIFPSTKQTVFRRLIHEVFDGTLPNAGEYSRWSVICSDFSPQFPYISDILVSSLTDRISFFNSRHSQIKDHPDVGPRTVNTATMLMNMHLYGVPLRSGMNQID